MPRKKKTAFCRNLLERKKALRLTWAEIGEAAGIGADAARSLARVEPKGIGLIAKIAKRLNTTPQDLAGWTEEGETNHG